MIALLVVAICIANIHGITVTHLFLFYGTFRASTLLPTVLTLEGKKLSSNGIFIGILCSLFIGLPVYSAGALYNIPVLQTVGSLLSLLLSGTVAIAMTRLEANKIASR